MEKRPVVNNLRKYGALIIFAVIFSSFIFSFTANAAPLLDWENPNKTGKMEPYKFKVTDVLNSDVMMRVVGCTGIVNKVSYAMTKFSSGVFDTLTKALTKQGREEIRENVCTILRGATEMVAAVTDGTTGGGNLTNALKDFLKCDETRKMEETIAAKASDKDAKDKEEAQRRMEQCFNGIGYQLAKNQLTSMTRYALNWVSTGFGGDPFFVQNTNSFISNIERNLLDQRIGFLSTTTGPYPYSGAFARSLVNTYRLERGGARALNDLTSTMSYFLTDPNSYLGKTELEKTRAALDKFATAPFKWDAYMAFTQDEANNYLGYQMVASDIINEELENARNEVREELLQNDGFLSQKKCVEYSKTETKDQANMKAPIAPLCEDPRSQECKNLQVNYKQKLLDYQNAAAKKEIQPKVCVKWETVTPGSIIKDKISNYLNSPERQAELADTINESLNSIFGILLSKLSDQGLSNITAQKFVYSDSNMMNTYKTDLDISFGLGRNNYNDGNFSLVRDLGNRYNYNYSKNSNLGTWNASINMAHRKDGTKEKLIKDIGPIVRNPNGDLSYPVNVYYVVTTGGKTSLFDNGYNGWEIGDRAFWDGEKWQNWKCGGVDANGLCKNQKHPIAQRGVIQIQKDYQVAVKELLQNLPNVMPKLGELDYCIPGPNLGWENNFGEAVTAFSDYAYSLGSEYKTGSWFLARDSSTFTIAKPGDEFYDNYYKIFEKTPSWWQKVKSTQTWINLNDLGSTGTLKKDKLENNIKDLIDAELNAINKKLTVFKDMYKEMIDSIYGQEGIMQTQFFYREDVEGQIENTAYLDVATTATPVIKQIKQYETDIADLTEEAKDNIIEADNNVYKLDKIKDEVSKIIKAAQARRDTEMIRILNEEAERTGLPVLTEASYKNKYAECLENENITFYDDLDIMRDGTSAQERCNDGLDNDWDELVDGDDPDCEGDYRRGSGNNGGGNNSGGDPFSGGDAFGNTDGDAFGGQNNNQGSGAFRR